MKIIWYIPRLNIGGAESLTISILNSLSNLNSIILITDKNKSSQINQLSKKIKVINLKDSTGFLYLSKLYGLRKILKKHATYIFVSNLTHANLNSYISLLFTKIKIIAIEHNTLSKYLFHKKNLKNYIINFLCKLIYKKFHKVITVSNYVKKDLVKKYRCNNCCTIHNAINKREIIKKSNKFKYKHNVPYIIFVGRLEKQKNLPRLLEIFHRLVINGIDHNLIIVGNGSQLPMLKEQVNKLRLSKRVVFLGERQNPFPYIKNADLSIMTSNFEGFGIFLIESLILGVKIFTYDKKIISEITNNSIFKNLFTAKNSQKANIRQIKLLLKTKIKKSKLINVGKQFDVKVVCKKYLRVIFS